MAGRWGDPSAFRADPAATPASRPSRRQTVALLVVLIAAAAAVAVASYVVRPERARAFELLHGSLFLADEQSPVAVDLASGKPTLRLVGAAKQVGVAGNDSLGVVPLDGGTLLLNKRTGEFNMVDSSGFIVKHDGGGVPLGRAPENTTAIGVASGDLAYIARNTPGRSEVYLVSQATVASAINATAAVRPRASTVFTDGSVETAPGGAVSADEALWALVRLTDGRYAVRQLAYPPQSNPGVRLTSTPHGVVSGPAALATASGHGGTSVGLATATRLTVFRGDSSTTIPFTPASRVDAVLPATNRGDRLAFLLHGTTGWMRISVGADGKDVRGPTRVTGIPPGAALAQPAYSGDALYTMDLNTGRIYRIDRDSRAGAISGAETYPLAQVKGVTVEQPTMPDGYAIARESRVIFNSGTHANALIVFTDGSRPPQRIEKSRAVQVSASGGAEQLTKTTVNPGQAPNPNPTDKGSKPRTNPQQVVNPHLDCKNVSQKPHIPVIGPTQAGSRSVTLSWTYPIVDRTQDCYPTTYVVDVKLLSTNAPQPPGRVTVESQVGATITGLFPLSRYEFTVTAYIHGQGTSSTPFQVRTGAEGPAAPTGLAVAADSSGNWVLNWESCGTVQQGCVPAESWTVTPSFCDGRGLSAPPAAATATADPTSKRQPTFQYRGSDALLGRGLQFVVIGSGKTQVQGTPSARSACVYSWSPAIPEAMRLSASQPPDTSLGGAATTNVTLDLGANPVRNVGGVGAQVTFTLSGNGKTQTKQATFTGSQTNLSVNFGGIEAGAAYTASATVRPAHGGSTVTIPSVDVSTRAEWPAVSLSADCPKTGLLTCELSVQVRGITSAQARGERFDFDGALTCDSAPALSHGFSRTGFDPADAFDGGEVNTLFFHGAGCRVQGTLRENAGSPNPEVFGGKPLDLSTSANLGAPPTSGAGQGDFDVAWGSPRSNGDTPITITYTGSDNLRQLTQDWSETVTPPGGGGCGPSANDFPDTTLVVSTECIADTGAGGGNWTVRISYANKSTGQRQGPFTYALDNPVPGYQYCSPAGFQATWNATKAEGVTVNSGGGDLSGCGSSWTYKLLSEPPGGDAHVCAIATEGPPPATVPIDVLLCTDDPAQGTWTVVVSWHDSADRTQTSDPIAVGGTPPPS